MFLRKALPRWLGCFLLLGAFSACQKSKEPVVATIGSVSITGSELATRLEDTPEGYQQYVASIEGRRQFLNLMIREKVLLEEGQKAGLQHDATYKKALADFKTRWDQKYRDYEESLLVQTYLRRLRSTELSVSDSDVQAYYNAHSDEYQHPMEIQVSHILLASPDEADHALERLKNGETFEAVARDMSRDPATAVRGGKLSPLRRGTLVPEFEDVAFKLKVGETSGIVKTLFGYHIIKKTAEKTLPPQSFDVVKEEIRSRMEREKFDRWVSEKQTALGVHVDEQALAAVSVPAAPPSLPSEEPSQP